MSLLLWSTIFPVVVFEFVTNRSITVNWRLSPVLLPNLASWPGCPRAARFARAHSDFVYFPSARIDLVCFPSHLVCPASIDFVTILRGSCNRSRILTSTAEDQKPIKRLTTNCSCRFTFTFTAIYIARRFTKVTIQG